MSGWLTADEYLASRGITKKDIENIFFMRENSHSGIIDCKKAYLKCDKDIDKALEYLRKESRGI